MRRLELPTILQNLKLFSPFWSSELAFMTGENDPRHREKRWNGL